MKKRNSTEQVQLRDPLNEQHKGRKKLISCIALVLGVAIIPLMYSGIYLASVWDTYGRLDTLPVAVVNHDQDPSPQPLCLKNLNEKLLAR